MPEVMSQIKKNILAIAIGIILALFIGFGIDTFYPAPDYQDFCEEKYAFSPDIYDTQEKCEEAEGKWLGEEEIEVNVEEIEVDVERIPPAKIMRIVNCDFTEYNKQCREEFNLVREPYERNIFIITLILGLIAIIIGGVVMKVESVSSGIMGGGVLTIIYGTMRYWGDMHKYLRFTVLTIVLVVLIWIGYKKFKD